MKFEIGILKLKLNIYIYEISNLNFKFIFFVITETYISEISQ